MRLQTIIAGLLLGFLGFFPQSAHSSQDLRHELAELAKGVKDFLDASKVDSIAIGQFTGPPSFPTSAGPGFVQVFTEELQKLNVIVKARAALGIRGEYRLTEVPADNADDARLGRKVLALNVQVSIEDNFGKPLLDLALKRIVRGSDSVANMIGLTVSLDPRGTEIERDRELRHQLTDPKSCIIKTIVRSRPESPYGLELIVNDQPREAQDKDGLAFVEISRGETYSVRLINDSDQELAVALRIDGLSMFAFSELRYTEGPRKGEPRYTVLIVGPRKSVIVPGWHVDNTKANKFLVTEYAKSAAASLHHTTNLGTITASFQASWPEGEPAPKDEPGRARSTGNGDATGFGPRIDQKLQEVKRNFGIIRDVISVRYTK